MKHILDNPMGEYAQVAKQLENPAIKLDMLARYAQGQNPAVPEFLALAEIKRRQSLMQHSPAPAQTTVQEDLVRSAQPQPMQQPTGLPAMQRPQGVAALPSGMGQQAFAGGGIVAFAGDQQSLVEEDPAEGLGYFERLKRYVNNLGGGVVPRGGAPVNASPAEVQAARVGKNIAAPADADAQLGGFYGGGKPSPAQFLAAHPNITEEDVMGPGKERAPEAIAKATGKKGAAAESEKDVGSAAPKEDMYSKYEKMLMDQAAESKASRQQDKYMRLLEAGLGIMGGTSQYALQNIGQGAMGAAKGYAQDQAGYRKEERENIRELMGLGLKKEEAQREAEKLAMTKELYGAHGKYYNAMANAAGVRASGAGAGVGMSKAQLSAATSMYNKWLSSNPMATEEERNAAWTEAQQRSGMAGGSAPVATPAYTWSPKGGLTPVGS